MAARLKYVDILKGFAIVAVVLFHINFMFPNSCPLLNWAVFGSLWHVPLFFLISGFFLTEKKLDNIRGFLKSKFKTLYVQGLYYFIPVALLHNVFLKWEWYSPDIPYSGEYMQILDVKSQIALVVKNVFLMSREPIVGAMWFIDSLLIAMVGIGVLNYLIKKLFKMSGGGVLIVTILFLMVLSNLLTNAYGVYIPKISNSVSAMGIIVLGQQLYQRGYCKYTNIYTFIAASLLLWNISLFDGEIGLNKNSFTSCLQLLGVSISSFYVFAYIAKLIENCWVGRIFAYIGERSFCIMGLHFVGFKTLSTLLSGITGMDYQTYALTTPELGNNFYLLLLYLSFGIVIPLGMLKIISMLKTSLYYVLKKTE